MDKKKNVWSSLQASTKLAIALQSPVIPLSHSTPKRSRARYGSCCSISGTLHPEWHWWIWLLRGQIHVLIGIGVALEAVSSPSYQLEGYNCVVNTTCEGDGYARLCSLTAGMCGAKHPLILHQEGLLYWTASLKSKYSILLKVGAGRGELEETK